MWFPLHLNQLILIAMLLIPLRWASHYKLSPTTSLIKYAPRQAICSFIWPHKSTSCARKREERAFGFSMTWHADMQQQQQPHRHHPPLATYSLNRVCGWLLEQRTKCFAFIVRKSWKLKLSPHKWKVSKPFGIIIYFWIENMRYRRSLFFVLRRM